MNGLGRYFILDFYFNLGMCMHTRFPPMLHESVIWMGLGEFDLILPRQIKLVDATDQCRDILISE